MTTMHTEMLPPARFLDALLGRAPWVGSRLNPMQPRGFVSPIEARLNLGLAYGDLQLREADALQERSLIHDVLTLVRALSTRVLASSSGLATRTKRPYLVATRVDGLTIQESVERIVDVSTLGHARVVHFVHAHALNLAWMNGALRRQLERADLVLPDGIGLRVAASLLGTPLVHNVNGTDLLPELCKVLAQRKIPLVLVGGARGTAARAAARLREEFPALEIPIVEHGFLKPDEIEDWRTRTRALGHCVVLVGMGTPIQESWVWKHCRDLDNVTAVTVGGLFDFAAGNVTRAPVVWREIGMEWVWRLLQEPRRLATRYLLGNPLFLALALVQKMRGTSLA